MSEAKWHKQRNNFWIMRVTDEDREAIARLAKFLNCSEAQAVKHAIYQCMQNSTREGKK